MSAQFPEERTKHFRTARKQTSSRAGESGQGVDPRLDPHAFSRLLIFRSEKETGDQPTSAVQGI